MRTPMIDVNLLSPEARVVTILRPRGGPAYEAALRDYAATHGVAVRLPGGRWGTGAPVRPSEASTGPSRAS